MLLFQHNFVPCNHGNMDLIGWLNGLKMTIVTISGESVKFIEYNNEDNVWIWCEIRECNPNQGHLKRCVLFRSRFKKKRYKLYKKDIKLKNYATKNTQ